MKLFHPFGMIIRQFEKYVYQFTLWTLNSLLRQTLFCSWLLSKPDLNRKQSLSVLLFRSTFSTFLVLKFWNDKWAKRSDEHSRRHTINLWVVMTFTIWVYIQVSIGQHKKLRFVKVHTGTDIRWSRASYLLMSWWNLKRIHNAMHVFFMLFL